MTTDPIPQSEVRELLGVTDGVLSSWRKKKQGPDWERRGWQEQLWYSKDETEVLRPALLTLGKYGLCIPGVARPLGDRVAQNDPIAGDTYISKYEAMEKLGVTSGIIDGWADRGVGPRAWRPSLRQPYRYRLKEVLDLRAALLILGSFNIGLPNCPPLLR